MLPGTLSRAIDPAAAPMFGGGVREPAPNATVNRTDPGLSGPDGDAVSPATAPRRRYVAPTLEHLGEWSALTLQQTVPIGPGAFLGALDDDLWIISLTK